MIFEEESLRKNKLRGLEGKVRGLNVLRGHVGSYRLGSDDWCT